MSPASVDVYMWGHHMATITDPPGPRISFRDRNRVRGTYEPKLEYTAPWLDRPDSIPLSLSIPLGRAPKAIRVGRYLDSLLPENPATLEDWHKRFRFDLGASTIEILQVVGEDVAGAAQFVQQGHVPSQHHRLVPLDDSEVADLLVDLRDSHGAAPFTADIPRVSLAGQQEKVGLHRRDGQWFLPQGLTPSTHILKPAPTRLPQIDRIEAALQHTAADIGINAAASDVMDIGGEPAFVSTRFDRFIGDDGIVDRVHQEDFTQALGVPHWRKYQRDNGPSLPQLINLIRTHATDADASIDAFVKLTAFNVAVSNSDAHAKNHSLLIRPGRIELAPAYDLTSTAPYPRYDQELSMKVGRQWRPLDVDEGDWVYLAKRANLDADRVLSIVSDTWLKIPDVLAAHIERFDVAATQAQPILQAGDSAATRARGFTTGSSTAPFPPSFADAIDHMTRADHVSAPDTTTVEPPAPPSLDQTNDAGPSL